MNNSSILPEEPEKKDLAEREAQLIRIIESLQAVQTSKEWSSLKTEIFDGLVTRLKSLIFTEAKKEQPDTLRLNRLSGQLEWAEKFADLSKLEAKYRTELTNVRIYNGRQEI